MATPISPSATHPDPVVLVHGASANMTENWQTLAPLLANNGYCVYALTYGVPALTPFPIDQIGGRNPPPPTSTPRSSISSDQPSQPSFACAAPVSSSAQIISMYFIPETSLPHRRTAMVRTGHPR
ncbi:esterase/lipase family protein [Kibdelosporangium lantanae]|uniref:Esterase/lipase family protein n=1 Tax=Kibdelosporangium lantanae TaxID=1497396 RepID=A0ABW3M501_9PSEU